MTPAQRALELLRTKPELLDSAARSLRRSRIAATRAKSRDGRQWYELPELERAMWRKRALALQLAKVRNQNPPRDPDPGQPAERVA